MKLMNNNHRFPFTDVRLKKLPIPAKGRTRYYDTQVPSLCLRVTHTGVLTFGVYRWRTKGGQPLQISLGRYPGMTIKEARAMALEKNLQINQGINPNTALHTSRQELSLQELFNSVLGREWRNLKSLKNVKSIFKCHLKHLGSRLLSEITADTVATLHAKIADNRGKYIANRSVEVISSLFNYAKKYGYVGPNPASDVEYEKEKERDRFIQPSEMPQFFKALNEEPNQTLRDFFILLLLTGVRRSNLLAMRWEEINFPERFWHIEDTKNGESQNVTLTSEAIRILEKRKNNGSDYVFESTTSKSGHIEEPKSAWRRILTRAGIKDLRVHDLRRTFGSYQVAQNASLQIVGKSLNHKSLQATRIYARLNMDPVRESVERGTQAILKAGGLAKQADVLTFEKKETVRRNA